MKRLVTALTALTLVASASTLCAGSLAGASTGLKYDFSSPRGITISGPDAFVANFSTNTVTEFNTSTGALVRVLKAANFEFHGPSAPAISGDDAFVANAGSNTVTEFNTSTGALVRVLKALRYMFDIPVTPEISGDNALVPNSEPGSNANVASNTVTEFNTSTGALIRVLKAARYQFLSPQDIAISGDDAFVVNARGRSSITEFNVVTGKLVRVLQAAPYNLAEPTAMAMAGKDEFVINARRKSVIEFNTRTGALVRVLSTKSFGGRGNSVLVGTGPQAVAIAGNVAVVIVPSYSHNFQNATFTVAEFNTSTGALVRALPGARYHFGKFVGSNCLAISGRDAFVTNTESNTVTEFNYSTGALIRILGE
jgi:outer membrane protein assembly factor BamB